MVRPRPPAAGAPRIAPAPAAAMCSRVALGSQLPSNRTDGDPRAAVVRTQPRRRPGQGGGAAERHATPGEERMATVAPSTRGGRLRRIRGALTRREWAGVAGMVGVVAGLHIVGW